MDGKKKIVQRQNPLTSTYAGREDLENLSLTSFKDMGMSPRVAKQLILDELSLEGVPILNLASFVTTWMEPEAEELMLKCISKNFIDHDEYPQIEHIHERCVTILSELLHAPKGQPPMGSATIGSSEAIMLAGLAHKFNWRRARQAKGEDTSRPNIVMGTDVQVCWDKFARYFDVEPRLVPIRKDRYIMTAKDVEPLIDENTICVGAVLGTTFTGEYDEIEEINRLLLKIKKEKGWDIPLHIDAASGGFISMFREDGIQWDFSLEQVKTINLSGHKYGLVYPGLGWLLFKSQADVPEELVFKVNYLGGDMPTYTLNFSRGCATVIAQYYNFLRLGFKGYQKIVNNMMQVSDIVKEGLLKTGYFSLLGDRRMEPVVSVTLKQPYPFSVFDISKLLRGYGWIVPAYTLPPDAQEIATLRIVVKENFSANLAYQFLDHVEKVLNELEGKGSDLSQKRSGKSIPH